MFHNYGKWYSVQPADVFCIIGSTIISHETVRRNVPPPERA